MLSFLKAHKEMLALLLAVAAALVFLSSFNVQQPYEKSPAGCTGEGWCREWINGSCTGNMQYLERECYRVVECRQQVYYERETVEVPSCP